MALHWQRCPAVEHWEVRDYHEGENPKEAFDKRKPYIAGCKVEDSGGGSCRVTLATGHIVKSAFKELIWGAYLRGFRTVWLERPGRGYRKYDVQKIIRQLKGR